MEKVKTTYNRRSFLKVSALTGGGFMIGINYLSGKTPAMTELNLPKDWFDFKGYIKITADNMIKIMSPNPEFGQNVMTSLPMIVAEELDVDWKDVIVEQAPHNNQIYGRQFTGGSMSVRTYWKPLREAGATARQMLREAAAQTWNVPVDEVTTKAGVLSHSSGKSAKYGDMAAKASTLPLPKTAKQKDPKDFKIIRSSRKNVEGEKIVTGKPLFGMDYRQEGMLIAMIQHPPAFGMNIKSFDAKEALKMKGIKDVFTFKLFEEGTERAGFDTRTFNEALAIVGNSTWEVMQARKKLKVEWMTAPEIKETINSWGGKQEVTIPSGLESTDVHLSKMADMAKQPAKQLRKDGDPEAAFKNAAQIIERTYTAPFLAHNCMEPMNCFAHVTPEKAFLAALYKPLNLLKVPLPAVSGCLLIQ